MTRLLPWLLLAACAPEELAGDDSSVLVVRTLAFVPAAEGVSPGFDLDDAVSTAGGASGCGIADMASPDGTPGIDNSFALLLPALELVGADALPELVQAAVTSGELLLLLETVPRDATCTELHVMRGAGAPLVGSDSLILPGQTFDVDPEAPASHVACAQVDETTIDAEGVSIRLPLVVFDEFIDLTMRHGRMRTERQPDGTVTGVLAGAVSAQEIKDNVATFDGLPDELFALIETTMDARADLDPEDTGTCTDVSVVLSFEAVPAFLYEDTERP